MFGYLNHSLLLRAGMAMGLITALAVASMASTVFVAHSIHGETSAVNLAGSLRMQSYRIAAAMETAHHDESQPFGDIKKLVAEFEQRLTSPRLTDVISTTSRKSILESYQLIMDQWQQAIRPQLQRYIQESIKPLAAGSLDKPRQAFRSNVGSFVDNIDNLVRLLEEDAESHIHLLGLFQGITLFLTLAVAFTTLYLLQIDVLEPLRDLLKATEQAGSGNFNARVAHAGADELGRLGATFNTMTADLSRMYGTLEEQVADKTRKLRQRNQSLELLYTATQTLTEAPVSERTYRKLLDDIGQLMEVDSLTLCLKDKRKNHAQRIARNGPIPPMCEQENCSLCLGKGQTQLLGKMEHGGSPNILSIPVGDKKISNGVLLVEVPSDKKLESWQIQLLETLGKHISISVDVTRRVTQHRRLALLEERSVIARELHDSLAQSLTYLKIQVTRISIMTRSGAEQDAVDSILLELKQGIESAYRQLRELLTTFRLQMDGQGLGSALAKTVEELNTRNNGIAIQLDNQLKLSPFSVNEEIHVLQIVREALSNITHHSKATWARVYLGTEEDKSIIVSIEDNGIGIPEKTEHTHHYGLAIMRERASSLQADLRIEQRNQGGAIVSLKFQPATNQQNSLSLLEEPAA